MVYLDHLKDRGWRYGPSSHLVCDGDLQELLDFGAKLDLSKSSIHWTKNIPHFDLTSKKYFKALELGAKLVDSRFIVRLKAENKRRGLYE